jgi:hypothetical protein
VHNMLTNPFFQRSTDEFLGWGVSQMWIAFSLSCDPGRHVRAWFRWFDIQNAIMKSWKPNPCLTLIQLCQQFSDGWDSMYGSNLFLGI